MGCFQQWCMIPAMSWFRFQDSYESLLWKSGNFPTLPNLESGVQIPKSGFANTVYIQGGWHASTHSSQYTALGPKSAPQTMVPILPLIFYMITNEHLLFDEEMQNRQTEGFAIASVYIWNFNIYGIWFWDRTGKSYYSNFSIGAFQNAWVAPPCKESTDCSL